jgi:hypothetical protein
MDSLGEHSPPPLPVRPPLLLDRPHQQPRDRSRLRTKPTSLLLVRDQPLQVEEEEQTPPAFRP